MWICPTTAYELFGKLFYEISVLNLLKTYWIGWNQWTNGFTKDKELIVSIRFEGKQFISSQRTRNN